ncbi:MAG: ATP-binding cassette domain-containing protein [Eubacteriales bacterium]|nr:ATP-binding cassette domain-containing protein [Eubacteriales bacterium]
MKKSGAAISVSGLKKSYQKKEVLRDVNFFVPKGSVYAVLGSNGAGKTTMIRILTTQIKADAGEISIGAYDLNRQPEKIREAISVTGQFSTVDEFLTGRENLMMIGKLRHLPNVKQTTQKLLNDFNLSDSANQIAASYSGGMRRKLDIAMSLVGNPQVIFLDEPTTGLDPQSRRNMWNLIQKLNQSGITIFLTTQYLEEAEQLADRIAILDKGMVIAEGTAEELKSNLPQGGIEISFGDPNTYEKAKEAMKEEIYSAVPEKYKITVLTDGRTESLARIIDIFAEKNLEIQRISQLTPNLEDVFLAMIEGKKEKKEWKQE